MARFTLRISEERHRALKAAAARSGRTLGEIVEASLEAYGVKTEEEAGDLVRRARERTGLDEDQAVAAAVEETWAERRR